MRARIRVNCILISNCEIYRFAHLDFTDVDSVKRALQLDRTELGGYRLVVQLANPKRDFHGISSGRGGDGGHQFSGRDGGDYGGRVGWRRIGGWSWHDAHYTRR